MFHPQYKFRVCAYRQCFDRCTLVKQFHFQPEPQQQQQPAAAAAAPKKSTEYYEALSDSDDDDDEEKTAAAGGDDGQATAQGTVDLFNVGYGRWIDRLYGG